MEIDTFRYCLRLYFAPITGAIRSIRTEHLRLPKESLGQSNCPILSLYS
jgi:hypothetical protein